MKVTNETSVVLRHGKEGKFSRGYYYEGPNGQQFYRTRREDYQQQQSPKQKWNSLSFAAAQKQLTPLWNNPEQAALIVQEWKDAMRIGPNNRSYPTAKGPKSRRKPQRKPLQRKRLTTCCVIRRKSSKPKLLHSANNSKPDTNNSVVTTKQAQVYQTCAYSSLD